MLQFIQSVVYSQSKGQLTLHLFCSHPKSLDSSNSSASASEILAVIIPKRKAPVMQIKNSSFFSDIIGRLCFVCVCSKSNANPFCRYRDSPDHMCSGFLCDWLFRGTYICHAFSVGSFSARKISR